MKQISLIVVFFLFPFCKGFSQISSERKLSVNEINYSVAKVFILKDKDTIGTASGFFYISDNLKYFITNRHVVLDSSQNFFPNKIALKLHSSNGILKDSKDVTVNLYENNIHLWLEHPDYHNKKCDIVAIPLNEQSIPQKSLFNFKNSIVNFFSNKNFLLDYKLQAFGHGIVIGYPLGYSDTENNLPIYRNAMIASEYGINFNGKENFIIDAKLHKGTSGSPVINSPNNLLIKDGQAIHSEATVLLGILSAGNPNLDINFVWYPYLIEEIINQ